MSADSHNPQPEDKQDDSSHPLSRLRQAGLLYQNLVDQRIAEAEAEGHFRNLPGAGKPLQIDDDSQVPEDDRAAFRLLKNAGFAPPWIELQKTIHEDRTRLNTWLQRINGRWERCGPL